MSAAVDDTLWSAIGEPTRRRILDRLLAADDATATSLSADLPVTRQAVAKHLSSLEEAGLVDRRRVGRETRYRLTPQPLTEAMAWMASVGGQWDERLERLRLVLEREGS